MKPAARSAASRATEIVRIRIDESSGMTQGAPELVVAGGESQLDTPRLARTVPRLVYRAHSAINNPGVADLDAVSAAANEPARARVKSERVSMSRSYVLTQLIQEQNGPRVPV